MYCVGPVNVGPSYQDQVVYAPDNDYSCYVTITNKTSNPLERAAQTVDRGFYVTYPPATIAPGATGRFWLQDLPDIFGSEGSTTYALGAGGNQLQFVYGCPTGVIQNYASGGSSFVASSGSVPDLSTPKTLSRRTVIRSSSTSPWKKGTSPEWETGRRGASSLSQSMRRDSDTTRGKTSSIRRWTLCSATSGTRTGMTLRRC